MKRNKYKDYLWYTAIAVFVICVLEGIFYYHSVESPFLKVMLNIQNAIKAYKIDPDIDQADALEYVKTAGGGVFTIILTYVYCIAVMYCRCFGNTCPQAGKLCKKPFKPAW